MTRKEKWANKREEIHIDAISEFTQRDYLAHILREMERLVELVEMLVKENVTDVDYSSAFDEMMGNPMEQLDHLCEVKK